MQKETLNKLRRYIDLAATQATASFTSPLVYHQEGGREQLWQEFIEAASSQCNPSHSWEVLLSDETMRVCTRCGQVQENYNE